MTNITVAGIGYTSNNITTAMQNIPVSGIGYSTTNFAIAFSNVNVVGTGIGAIRTPIVTYSTVNNLDGTTSTIVSTEVFNPDGTTTSYEQITTIQDNGTVVVNGSLGPYADSPSATNTANVIFNNSYLNEYSAPYIGNNSTSNKKQLKLTFGAIPLNYTS